MVPAPMRAHATDVIDHADGGEKRGNGEQKAGLVLGEVREQEGDGKAEQDEEAAAQEGWGSRIEKARLHLERIPC